MVAFSPPASQPSESRMMVLLEQGCAEQSVVQQTLDACTNEQVERLEQAMDVIYRQHSHGYRHGYQADWQLLDADMSGLPCGPNAAFATKGYFAKQRNRRSRQVDRLLASRYNEVVVEMKERTDWGYVDDTR